MTARTSQVPLLDQISERLIVQRLRCRPSFCAIALTADRISGLTELNFSRDRVVMARPGFVEIMTHHDMS